MIPSKILDLIADLETRASMLKREHAHELAAQMLDTALELRAAYDGEEDTLMNLDEAVDYSRGYHRKYLGRTLENYGTLRNPRYRKGDVPRKPVRR